MSNDFSHKIPTNESHSIWKDCLDFKNEGFTTIIEIFDHIHEPRSKFGLWLLDAGKIDPEKILFSDYILLVAHASMLSKHDASRLIFDSSSNNSSTLKINDWEIYVETILSVENIHHQKEIAINAFDRFSNKNVHGESVLYFEDFAKITKQFPFLDVPFARLLTNIRKYNLGETTWRQKRQEIQKAYKLLSEQG